MISYIIKILIGPRIINNQHRYLWDSESNYKYIINSNGNILLLSPV